MYSMLKMRFTIFDGFMIQEMDIDDIIKRAETLYA
jgi:hypothetical protein